MLRILLICVLVATIGCSSAKAAVVDDGLRRCVTILAWVASEHDHELRSGPSAGLDAIRGPRLPKYPATAYGGRVSTLPGLVDQHCDSYIDVEFLESVRAAPIR